MANDSTTVALVWLGVVIVVSQGWLNNARKYVRSKTLHTDASPPVADPGADFGHAAKGQAVGTFGPPDRSYGTPARTQ